MESMKLLWVPLQFSPISRWLLDKNSPELQYIETKWASLISYQLTAKMLQDVLPVGETENASTVRNHLQKIAKRKEKELVCPRRGLGVLIQNSRLQNNAAAIFPPNRNFL